MNRYRRLIVCVLILTMTLTTTVSFSFATHPFIDVSYGDWYSDSVDYCYQNGLMRGVSPTRFSPDSSMDRAMVVTILYRLAGEPAVDKSDGHPFVDVKSNAWYSDAVTWGYQNQIVMGVTSTLFAPDADITREQMATFFYRYAQYSGLNVKTIANLRHYEDDKQISEYAFYAFQWAFGNGIITGTSSSRLSPNRVATRAQCAVMLVRYINVMNDSANSNRVLSPKITSVHEYVRLVPSLWEESVACKDAPDSESDTVFSTIYAKLFIRTGICDNGWSQVRVIDDRYSNELVYVPTDYLTGNENRHNDSSVMSEVLHRSNMLGRLTIPDVGVNVAFFRGTGDSQAVTDAADSAAFIIMHDQFVIADHNYQGFSAMKNSVPGKTVAVLNFGTYTETYICTDKFIGSSRKIDGKEYLCDSNGNAIDHQNFGGMAMYTCNEGKKTVTVTYWKLNK